jgi:alpha-L-rhamnosidase
MVAGAAAASGGAALASGISRAVLRPARLRCEYQTEPLAIDTAEPRFSWILESDPEARQIRQVAYRIRVATSSELLDSGQPDLWDSGQVHSDRQLHVVYDGRTLQRHQRCYWEVEVWSDPDVAGQRARSWFETAFLDPAAWQAIWVGSDRPLPETEEAMYADDPAPMLRRSFRVEKPVVRARLFATALGYADVRLNGRAVSDAVLDPPWTSTRKRIQYRVFDVTDALVAGENVLGAMLGNGWRNPLPLRMWGRINLREHLDVGRPALLCELHLDLEDGSTQIVASDEHWRLADGPVLRNSVYLGEHVDARQAQPGWDAPGFNDRKWRSAALSPDQPGLGDTGPRLEAATIPPIRVTRTLKPVSINEVSPGVWIADMGQNFAGWARLRVRGRRGTEVRMRLGELRYEDGTLNPMTAVAGQIKRLREDGTSVGGPGAPEVAWQENVYILSGDGEEVYTPRFTFHGFRYVELTGYPGTPGPDAIEGLRLNTDIRPIGSFRCSNEAFNRIQDMVEWTLLSNVFSVQSDCPAREKFQYGGDIVASSDMAFLTHDMATFYAKSAQDHVDDRTSEGWFTETAPFVGIQAANYAPNAGPIGWGLAHPLLVTQLMQYAGNERLMGAQYEAAKRWVDLLWEASDAGVIDRCIGDHESLDPKPIALVATAQLYQALGMVAVMARMLGMAADKEALDERAERVRERFNEQFLKIGSGTYDSGTQAAQATALFSGLVPDAERQAAVQRMVDAVVGDHGGHIAAGIFGTKYLLRMLTETGNAQVAYDLVNQSGYPGWRHMLENGATTLWETWAQSDNTYSQNHPMFGSVSEWFFRCLGGINPAADAIGFDRIQLQPFIADDLDWVETRYDSIRGPVGLRWERKDPRIELQVRIPAGITAYLLLPTPVVAAIEEGGRSIQDHPELTAERTPDRRVRLALGSGVWMFSFPSA